MYPVSQDFLEKIQENNRLFEVKIQIHHSQGVLDITDKELAQGTLIYTESSQAGEEFTIGSTVASDISFTILNKPGYEDIQFIGATVFCNIGLLVKEGADAHFLQPSQPSKMKGFEEKWEYVPLGRFNIDYVNIQRNSIELKAIDNMINLDRPYSLSKLSYPATLYQIYVNACNVCDVLPGTVNFPNMHYVVQNRPDGDLTFRDIIGYIAEVSGTFAKCNRNGALELRWYTPTNITLGPANRFDFKTSDDLVQIKGVMATVEDTTYLAGSEDYAIDLSENPLLQGGYETVLPNIFNNIKNTIFTPYTSGWQGNPALMAGDLITQIDRDGKVYNTLITKSIFKYRGRSTLEAKGLPEISLGYKGSTNRKIAQIKKRIEEDIGDQLTNLEQAQLNATQLLANMLGGHFIEDKENGIFYIANHPDLSKATEYWKGGIGGFGHYKNGILDTSITADGSIVAMLVAANIVTANMVQTGILQSKDGSTWMNLDNSEFSLAKGNIWIDKDKVRVYHTTDKTQYTDLRYNGVFRKWEYGDGAYLNDIFIHYETSSIQATPYPPTTRVYLPSRFKGRRVNIAVGGGNTYFSIGRRYNDGTVGRLTNWVETVYRIYRSDMDAATPYIDVEAYAWAREYDANNEVREDYTKSGFVLIVIGE